jgi:hypothetical protein
MNAEISAFGLRCLYFEPGYFRTSILSPENRPPYESRISDYAEMTAAYHATLDGTFPYFVCDVVS